MARLSLLGDLLREAARDAADAEAFRYRGERLTYRDWDALADRTASPAVLALTVIIGSVYLLAMPSFAQAVLELVLAGVDDIRAARRFGRPCCRSRSLATATKKRQLGSERWPRMLR